jgi:hypothetical protein
MLLSIEDVRCLSKEEKEGRVGRREGTDGYIYTVIR